LPRYAEDLQKPWKLNLSASLAGKVEFLLTDNLTKQPIYGARVQLVEGLLEWWIAREEGRPLPDVPSLSQLRSRSR
jgi:hypothetical protein